MNNDTIRHNIAIIKIVTNIKWVLELKRLPMKIGSEFPALSL